MCGDAVCSCFCRRRINPLRSDFCRESYALRTQTHKTSTHQEHTRIELQRLTNILRGNRICTDAFVRLICPSLRSAAASSTALLCSRRTPTETRRRDWSPRMPCSVDCPTAPPRIRVRLVCCRSSQNAREQARRSTIDARCVIPQRDLPPTLAFPALLSLCVAAV